ncbi:hypothetical protein CcaverHIS002_0505480 [Cutaneotrichosporon cavernicola]|uniref:LYR motif-containing protein Cup1-like N-terminal domain-containing protein n=1 Tax=Cutaneotrichosporon cavernicola TaxID=279322 RepID=A0AA48QX72_9TREE|nr:uncharacterized protein CcaverHIS019_0506000 [Cutaneotrichosporon cavernicola]BEI85147.1 hypothetical protein CcaverHIS002_0505480 [Cutaneotrichosporon cavernicola]BEI92972.1 hypothetical protein CcaverHIS019_0506000 [Cutaneotrichosporon cavernicola]BEJ00748.1 hypothetical protein CcaverHIS631_0506050 [Cutaneotrichosporon cavernicola]BEJ08514.1 hypothetical protein CcaverHIS641_0506080 [Cutaneotrichosporon cavernicola]
MASPAQLKELGMAAPTRTHPSRFLPPTPRATYRTVLQCLRFIQDPHVWLIATIRFRSLIKDANKHLPAYLKDDSPELEVCKEQRARARKHLKKELTEVRAATACHPHALLRLIEECYGVRGRVRWELIKNITLSSPLDPKDWPRAVTDKIPNPETRYPPMTLQPLPPCLRPLSKKPPAGLIGVRARTVIPRAAVNREARKEWEYQWDNVSVPIVMPANEDGAATGWEGKGVIETMRAMAGFDSSPFPPTPPRRAGAVKPKSPKEPLPSFNNLPNSLKAAFPRRPPSSYRTLPSFPQPRVALTRDNPRTWSNPRKMTPRLLRRTYNDVWERLDWVAKMPFRSDSQGRMLGGWKRTDWAMVSTGRSSSGPNDWREAGSRWAEATENELKWLTEDELEGNWDEMRLRVARQKASVRANKAQKAKEAVVPKEATAAKEAE